jgi:hypothetical protein
VAPAFLVNAASFAVSALLAGLQLPGQPPAIAASSWLSPVGEGARLLVAGRLLRLLALVQLLAALSAGATSALLVVLAGRHLGVGPGGFGMRRLQQERSTSSIGYSRTSTTCGHEWIAASISR